MALPRKNVEPSRRRDDDVEHVLVPTRSKQLFDWDDMGLGLEGPLSSSASVSSDSSSEHGEIGLRSATPKRNTDVHQPTFAWVRNLIDCRKAKNQKTSLDDHAFRTTGKGWLRDQHAALENGTIPVMFKCIIAASAISKLFSRCREDFKRPEYRSRYWVWSINFILLIDYFIEYGNINVTDKVPRKYHELLPFLSTCKEQKRQGTISTQKEQLLTALGIVWHKEVASSDGDADESDDETYDGDSQGDETWEMPSKNNLSKRPKKSVQSRTSGKKKRKILTREIGKPLTKEESPPPNHAPMIRPPRSLKTWAQQMLALRRHYRKQRGEDDLYAIPSDQLSLRIWMNAETARCSTGALNEVCRAILKAAEMANDEDVGEVDNECENWAKGFVAYLDFVIRKKKPRDEAVDFMCACRRAVFNGTLLQDRDALLRGVNEDWFESDEMKTCVRINQQRRSERPGQVGHAGRLHSLELLELDGNASDEFNGHVVEVVLDSGTNKIDETVDRKKRRRTATLVRQKLSSMIGGEVAIHVEGRKPTSAEMDAREWVLRAGAKEFDVYARNWFRAANAKRQ